MNNDDGRQYKKVQKQGEGSITYSSLNRHKRFTKHTLKKLGRRAAFLLSPWPIPCLQPPPIYDSSSGIDALTAAQSMMLKWCTGGWGTGGCGTGGCGTGGWGGRLAAASLCAIVDRAGRECEG